MTRDRRRLQVDDDLAAAVTVEAHVPGRPRGPGVLLTHGAGKDLDTRHLVGLAEGLAADGVLTVRVNQPWKESGRAAPPPPERLTGGYRAVAEAVRRVFGPRRGWVWGGHSNGARIASHAVVAAAEGDGRLPVGLLLVSYPLHPPGRPERLRVDHWAGVVVPTLVLQGTNDAFGSGDEVRAHAPSFGAPATVVDVAGADHGWAVPRTRASDGRRHEPDEVGRDRADEVTSWLATMR